MKCVILGYVLLATTSIATAQSVDEQISEARRIVSAFEAAGTGLVVVDNKLIEMPVLRSMYRILSIADR